MGDRRRVYVCILAGMLIAVFLANPSLAISAGQSEVVITSYSLTNPTLGYSDVDKSHNGTGSWSSNYYNDLNSNDKHDPGEPFSDSTQTGWKQAADNSCWLASACNMLKQAGLVASAESLYADYAMNGVPDKAGNTLTWDDGGLQEYAINYFKNQNPQLCANLQIQTFVGTNYIFTGNGVFAWEDINPLLTVETYLAQGGQVGIGMWPLMNSTGEHLGGHALTMQELDATTFSCTDSDRDSDYINGAGDLNTYSDICFGPISSGGHNYYGWYNDFYNGNINYYPVGDFGYICAITVPEPATVLLMFAAIGLMRAKHRA